MTKTIKAIKHEGSAFSGECYTVLAGHAGRTVGTGTKVHIAEGHYNSKGQFILGATACSSNGQLRGTSVIPGRDFSAVTCKNCGTSPLLAESRNARAIDIEVGR